MSMPHDQPTVTPYLICDGAAQAMEFYRAVFGAQAVGTLAMPGGKIGHAQMRIGNALIMLADEFPEMDTFGPKRIGGTPVKLQVYVEDCDAVVAKALERGATLTRPIEDKFYGDRAGMITDPFGHVWNVSTRKENLTWEEIEQRARKMFGG